MRTAIYGTENAISIHERARPVVELPSVAFAVERVLVAADGEDLPTRLALGHEDHVADGGRLLVAPLGDERVGDDVALGAARLPPFIRAAERVVALVGAHPRDLDGAVFAEGGHNVVDAAVVEGLRVGGDCVANGFGHFCNRAHRCPTLDRSVQSAAWPPATMSTCWSWAPASPASTRCTAP